MSRIEQSIHQITRRQCLSQSSSIAGCAALCSLLDSERSIAETSNSHTGVLFPHVAPRAKRVIYLCQSGAPSQMDLFDYKPKTQKWAGKDLPDSVFGDQRLTTMTSKQEAFPVATSMFKFAKHGETGTWLSELLPWTSSIVDDCCFVCSMHTEAINHDPAITLLQTGSQQAGRPSLGSWVSYGLGSTNQNLPAFVALVSATVRTGQP